jgi:hypothetical protein
MLFIPNFKEQDQLHLNQRLSREGKANGPVASNPVAGIIVATNPGNFQGDEVISPLPAFNFYICEAKFISCSTNAPK